MESNKTVTDNKLKMSLLETDIDDLRKENMELKKQNLEFNERLNALEAILSDGHNNISATSGI